MSIMRTDAHTHKIPAAPNRTALINLSPGENPGGKTENLFFSCGIHPADCGRFTMDALRKTLTQVPCSALGECGLDASIPVDPDFQEKIFRAQIELAEELNLPLVIHCVRQYYDLIRIRKETAAKIPWLIHGFRGKPETGKALLNAGMILSLSPVWLMHRESFPDWLPDGAFLLETDESDIPLPSLYEHAIRLRKDTMERFGMMLQETFEKFLGIGTALHSSSSFSSSASSSPDSRARG